jgi:hypothetical protein
MNETLLMDTMFDAWYGVASLLALIIAYQIQK